MPVILLENSGQKGFETFAAALVEGAAKQGFKQIKLIERDPDEISHLEYSISKKNRIAHDYTQALESSVVKSFYIAVSGSDEIVEIEQMLEGLEKDFAAVNEAEYNMQNENKTLHEKVEQLQYQLSVAKQEISHMASHMAVLSSTSQASLLQNYYNNEYEVLPRWYKQVGHVLKVIQGKRTLQSLFDKKAKKYRS